MPLNKSWLLEKVSMFFPHFLWHHHSSLEPSKTQQPHSKITCAEPTPTEQNWKWFSSVGVTLGCGSKFIPGVFTRQLEDVCVCLFLRRCFGRWVIKGHAITITYTAQHFIIASTNYCFAKSPCLVTTILFFPLSPSFFSFCHCYNFRETQMLPTGDNKRIAAHRN